MSASSLTTCDVAMTELLVDPFYLEEGDSIVAVVEALNNIGYSPPSVENSIGALT